jgi:uncharacterized membrane protein
MNGGTLFAITNIAIALLAILLGFFAYVKNKKNEVNIYWFLTSLSIMIWSFSLAAVVLARSYFVANIWQYILDASAIWVPGFFLVFIMAVIGRPQNKKAMYFFALVAPLLVSVFTLLPCYRSGLIPTFVFKFWVNPGSCYHVAPVVYAVYVLLSLFLLIKYEKKSSGTKKQQLKYILNRR